MEIKALKEAILANKIPEDFMIFLYQDNTFLVDQYIDEIAYKRSLAKNRLSYLSEQKSSALSLVFDYEDKLNILRVDTFDEVHEDYAEFTNTIVVCKKIDKRITALVRPYVVNFPKLVDWQVQDYMHLKCPGLSEQDIKWLYTITNGDIYRITSELDKVNLFSTDKQSLILRGIREEDGSDLYNYDILKIRQDLLNNKLRSVKEFIQHESLVNADPVGFNNLLLLVVKKILYVNFGKEAKISLEEAGVNPYEAKHIKEDYASISFSRVAKLLKFLSATDLKLKSNLLDMTKEQLLDYVICNVITV